MSSTEDSNPVEPKKTAKSTVKPVRYELLADLYYSDKAVSAGEIVDDLPSKSVKWLLEGDYIRKVED